MFSTALYNEIATTRLVEMQPVAMRNHLRMFLSHYRELPASERDKRPDRPFLLAASRNFDINEKIYLGNAASIARWEDLDETDVVINVVRFSGPIMRNGGACAWGSMELRDMIKRAADVKQCIGQIFIVDTPGGSSASKYDFKEALDYARSKGQLTYMLVDGMLMSAGMAWGACCDKRYAMNAHNLMGCMGTYAAFFTLQSGEKNAITQEVFHEVYADGSPMKNKAYRDASTGDETLIQEEVNRSNLRYIEIIRQGIPRVTDEQLKGADYEAGEVIGTLCDGIRTFDQVVNEMLAAKGIRASVGGAEGGTSEQSAAGGTFEGGGQIAMQSGKKSETPEPGKDPDDEPEDPDTPGDPNDPVDPNDPDEEPDDEDPDKKKAKTKPKTDSKKMGKEYQHIQSALETEALVSDKENALYLHEELCDKLESFVEKSAQVQASLAAKVEEVKQLNEAVKQAREAHTAEVEQLNAAHAETLENASKEAEAKIQEQIGNLEAEKEELRQQLEVARQENERLEAVIAEKETELSELGKAPGEQAQPKVHAPEAGKSENTALPSSKGTLKEQREARAKYMEQLRIRK